MDMKNPTALAIFTAICCLALAAGASVDIGEKFLILQNSDNPSGQDQLRLMVLTQPEEREDIENCETFTDQELVREVLSSSENPKIMKVSSEDMENLLEDCELISRRRRKREDSAGIFRNSRNSRSRRRNPESSDPNGEREIPASDDRGSRSQFDNGPPNRVTESPVEGAPEGYDGWNVIWPGTKWCGAGDIAKGDDDLGLHADTDKCCRAHDKCDDLMAPGETKNNLTNSSPFTKLSCKCDEDFYNCLDRVDSVISNGIGNLYFNVLKRECYVADHPDSKKCKKYMTFLKLKCKEYEKDTKSPKVYQWKSAKFYKKIPFPGSLTFTLPF